MYALSCVFLIIEWVAIFGLFGAFGSHVRKDPQTFYTVAVIGIAAFAFVILTSNLAKV